MPSRVTGKCGSFIEALDVVDEYDAVSNHCRSRNEIFMEPISIARYLVHGSSAS